MYAAVDDRNMSIQELEPRYQYEKPKRPVKVIKADKDKDRFIESHELSLLSLLVAKHPDRAKEFLARLKQSMV
jgi:hypothetical protein